jgi:alanyl-tRNA synthetase
MKSNELREEFLLFFKSKQHTIVPSAPMVIKNDPTLMFTNAGMNQFKDIFLGNKPAGYKRVADSQKCLRVSGKHNDLEEVGLDTYHHTMFEMLGNWSFGDYFKKEAIEWAWEFLTKRLGIDEDRLYATIFEGNADENVSRDDEAYSYWEKCFTNPKGKILEGSKKDNFWEMGETGPCGPCSEIHVDLRSAEERSVIQGEQLVNKGHPQVIEIWNLVFIQYNRKANGSLELLPSHHVDTGMGFERLCMVVQGKKSNYDTDVFQPIISEIAEITGKSYGSDEKTDIAHRVIADHLRTIAFSVADGQLPSNNRAGYVIRRILRRAVRYGYTTMEMTEPFIYRLVPVLVQTMGSHYPELISQKEIITKVIHEEEQSFLRTLGKGLRMIEKKIEELKETNGNVFSGKVAFELYDTYGFPVDLTQLILRENDLTLNNEEFTQELNIQKERSRSDAAKVSGDWVVLRESEATVFTGYDKTEDDILITRYRMVNVKGRNLYHLVFDKTPFYAESGGQTGDKGYIESDNERIEITDTVKENNLIIHITTSQPSEATAPFRAVINEKARQLTARNHTATHLMHFALRSVLGTHVEQKGSLVAPEKLRFDFSHFNRMTPEEIGQVEQMVNNFIMNNIARVVHEDVPVDEAKNMGAMALFGEKYGDRVRVIRFGNSVELCGGTHVESTGTIGLFKIISEGAVAAGIRRIEAVTSENALRYVNEKLNSLNEISGLIKSTGNIVAGVTKLVEENKNLQQTIDKMQESAALGKRNELTAKAEKVSGCTLYSGVLEETTADMLKTIAHQLRQTESDAAIVLGGSFEGKASLLVAFSDSFITRKGVNAVDIIKSVSSMINGGGGGQPFLATAGGKKPEGLYDAVKRATDEIKSGI